MSNREESEPTFAGFALPEQNWFRLPDDWINISAGITNIAELKVIQYILRHTWGFQEYDIKKHITIDEFVRGRKRRDGSRMDKGTGLSERAVRYGLADALRHGYIEEETDASDRARIRKSYALKMQRRLPAGNPPPNNGAAAADRQDLQAEVQSLHPEVQDVHPRGAAFAPRTEIETSDRSLEDQSSSKIKNSFFSPSKSDSKLSTSLRTQTNGVLQAPDPKAATTPPTPTGTATIRDVLTAKGLLAPTTSDTSQPRSIPAAHHTRQLPTPTGEGAVVGRSGTAQTMSATLAAAGAAVHEPPRRRGRPPKARAATVPPPAFISNVITDFTRLFNDDEQAIRSNITQATNLWQQSGMSEVDFVQQVLYPARSLAQQARVTKRSSNGLGPNRMPYYFRVVRDKLGLTPERPP